MSVLTSDFDVDWRLGGDSVAFLRDCGKEERHWQTVALLGGSDLD